MSVSTASKRKTLTDPTTAMLLALDVNVEHSRSRSSKQRRATIAAYLAALETVMFSDAGNVTASISSRRSKGRTIRSGKAWYDFCCIHIGPCLGLPKGPSFRLPFAHSLTRQDRIRIRESHCQRVPRPILHLFSGCSVRLFSSISHVP
jgi:hypothetical protein